MTRIASRLAVVVMVVAGSLVTAQARAALVQYFPFDGNVNNAIGGGVVATNGGATFTNLQAAPGIGSSEAAEFSGAATGIVVSGGLDVAALQSLFHGDFTVSTWARSDVPGSAVNNANIA